MGINKVNKVGSNEAPQITSDNKKNSVKDEIAIIFEEYEKEKESGKKKISKLNDTFEKGVVEKFEYDEPQDSNKTIEVEHGGQSGKF